MSRGLGIWQREILDRIANSDLLIPLGGDTRSAQAAILRAAKSLEKAGRCIIVRLWDDDRRVVLPYVCRPDRTFDGKPIKEISVARVTYGTGTALTGSTRDIAKRERVSRMTIWRDIQKFKGRADEVAAKVRLARIRRDVKRLTRSEIGQVRRWLSERDDDLWQAEMDAEGGSIEHKCGSR